VLPPIHIIGIPGFDWIAFGVGLSVSLYWLRALRLARQGIRLFLQNFARATLVFCAIMLIFAAIRSRTHYIAAQEEVVAGFVALLTFAKWQRNRRSRYIPKRIRRSVVERDLKGETFDPTKHHIDHIWPFSKGGSHTTDNLRVIEKARNLR
jgi:hypothetical protein